MFLQERTAKHGASLRNRECTESSESLQRTSFGSGGALSTSCAEETCRARGAICRKSVQGEAACVTGGHLHRRWRRGRELSQSYLNYGAHNSAFARTTHPRVQEMGLAHFWLSELPKDLGYSFYSKNVAIWRATTHVNGRPPLQTVAVSSSQSGGWDCVGVKVRVFRHWIGG